MRHLLPVLVSSLILGACAAGNDAATNADGGDDSARKHKDASVDARKLVDAETRPDASTGSGSGSGDGTPIRNACSNTFGRGLTGGFGRLDGILVSVIAPKSGSACNEDSTHVHLQVEMSGALYDIAINVDGGFYEEADLGLPGGAWSAGWHASDRLDYVTTLGIHSSSFTTGSQSTISAWLQSNLTTVNHISVFGTTYTGSDAGSGMHDIHRQATNEDGAIVIDPLSATPHMLLFRFSSPSF